VRVSVDQPGLDAGVEVVDAGGEVVAPVQEGVAVAGAEGLGVLAAGQLQRKALWPAARLRD
jgi:hypothetical protein